MSTEPPLSLLWPYDLSPVNLLRPVSWFDVLDGHRNCLVRGVQYVDYVLDDFCGKSGLLLLGSSLMELHDDVGIEFSLLLLSSRVLPVPVAKEAAKGFAVDPHAIALITARRQGTAFAQLVDMCGRAAEQCCRLRHVDGGARCPQLRPWHMWGTSEDDRAPLCRRERCHCQLIQVQDGPRRLVARKARLLAAVGIDHHERLRA